MLIPGTRYRKIAEDVAYNAPEHKTVLIDCFAGAGGNVIAFALSDRWDRIFAIEKDPATIACAKNNASIYGVDKKIFWIQGDCFSEIKKRFKGFGMGKEVVIFGSPPWGGELHPCPWLTYLVYRLYSLGTGPDYATDEVFDLNQMEPYPLDYLHRTFSGITTEFIIFLPRTSNLKQLATLVPDNKKMDVMHYSMNGFSKVS